MVDPGLPGAFFVAAPGDFAEKGRAMIRLEKVTVKLPGFAVHDISLHVEQGEFFALLGPTAAGKTVILESIAGLVRVTRGRIRMAGRDMTRCPPERRRIGIVYQDCALFPHLTVIQNIRYGLRYFGMDTVEGRKRVDRLIAMLDLGRIVSRRPLHLSGGEMQRVSLARALSVNPSVLLLDEPLSALDPNFRWEIRRVLKELHGEFGITFMMVTHDFDEALYLADRVAIIREGRMEQIGGTEEVFQKPATPFVAEFVGMKNIFPAFSSNGFVKFGGLSCPLPPGSDREFRHVALRPEDIRLGREGDFPPGQMTCRGEIIRIMQLGFVHEVSVRCGEVEFKTCLDRKTLHQSGIQEGEPVEVAFDPADLHVF
jgi:molybdate/tungstate transport system ATP-binding protein